MKLRIALGGGCTIFLLGIPTSLAPIGLEPVQSLGNALIVAGSIMIGAWLIASSLSSNHI
jgi:hypothetical protein